MFRVALRNVLIMIGAALPALMLCIYLIGWIIDGAGLRALVGERLVLVTWWYALFFVPALAVATVHQVLLLAIPAGWPRMRMRLVILVTASLPVALLVRYFNSNATVAELSKTCLTLLPGLLTYGLLAQPLRRAKHHSRDRAPLVSLVGDRTP